MNKVARVLLVLAVIAWFAAPASLAAGEKANTFRFFVGYLSATGDFKGTTGVDQDGTLVEAQEKVEYQGTVGGGIGYEHKFSDLFGLDVALQYYKPDIKASIAGLGEQKFTGKIMPLTVGAMFHVLRGSAIDFFLGPEVAYVTYGDITIPVAEDIDGTITTVDEKVKFKSQVTWGAKVGLDVPFGENWAFNANLEYLDAKSEVDTVGGASGSEKLNAKPFIVTAGVGYKW